MGIEFALPNAPVKAENRTWSVVVECGFDTAVDDRTVTYHREVVPLDADGNRAGDSNQHRVAVGNGFLPLRVTSRYADLAERSFTAEGVTVTGSQMMALVAKIGDTLWEEAVAAEIARQNDPQDED